MRDTRPLPRRALSLLPGYLSVSGLVTLLTALVVVLSASIALRNLRLGGGGLYFGDDLTPTTARITLEEGVSTTSLTLRTGEIAGSGPLTVTGAFAWYGGHLMMTGTIFVAPG